MACLNRSRTRDAPTPTNISTKSEPLMVREWGMGEKIGFVFYGDEEPTNGFMDLSSRDFSDSTAEKIDKEIKQILDQAYIDAKKLLMENREKVDMIAKALLQFETVSGEEVNALIRGESIERTGVDDLLDSAAPQKPVGVARPVKVDPKPQTDVDPGTLPQPG